MRRKVGKVKAPVISKAKRLSFIRNSVPRALVGQMSGRITPEAALVAAIISTAALDLLDPEKEESRHYRSARRYFYGPEFERHCELIDLNPDWIRDIAFKARAWMDAERKTKKSREGA